MASVLQKNVVIGLISLVECFVMDLLVFSRFRGCIPLQMIDTAH
jgi:hypothetical protein